MKSSVDFKPFGNVGQKERLASLVGGGGLLLFTLLRSNRFKVPLLVGSGYLLMRGITGKDPAYQALGIDRGGDNGKSILVEKMMTINRPRQEVYQYWRDFTNFPHFMQHLEQVQILDGDGGRRSYWTAKAPLDMQVEWEAEMVEDRENEFIVWRSIPGSQIENRGSVRFQDSPGGHGTEVYVTLEYNPPGGAAGAAFARIFGEEPTQQVRDDLRHFKQILETGEITTVEGQSSGRIDEVALERQEVGQMHHAKYYDASQSTW